MLGSVEQQSGNCCLWEGENLLLRLIVQTIEVISEAHLHIQLACKQLLDIREVCRTTRKDNSARELRGELCGLQLTGYKACDILQSLLCNLGNVALQNLLLGMSRSLNRDSCIVRHPVGSSRAVAFFQLVDIALRDFEKIVQVVIDSRRSDRQRREVPQLATLDHRDIGEVASEIDNRYTLLALVLTEQQLGQKRRVDTESARLNLGTMQSSLDKLNLLLAHHNEEVGGRELVSEGSERVFHLLLIVDIVTQRYALDNLVATSGYHHLDTRIQLTQLVLGNASRLIANLYIILVLHAIDRTARDSDIGRIKTTPKLVFQRTLSVGDSVAQIHIVHYIAILDTAIYLLNLDSENRYFSALIADTCRHNDARRAYVYSDYIISILHIYFVQITCLSYLTSITRYSSQPM